MGLCSHDEKILRGGEAVVEQKRKTGDLIEKNRAQAQKLIRLYMKELSSPQKLEAAPLNQIASALGTLVEKFSKGGDEAGDTAIIVTHSVPRATGEEGGS